MPSQPVTDEGFLERLQAIYAETGYLVMGSSSPCFVGDIVPSQDFRDEDVRNKNIRFRVVGAVTVEEYYAQLLTAKRTWGYAYYYKVEVLD